MTLPFPQDGSPARPAPPPFAPSGPPGGATPPAAAGDGGHLDELEAMLLADGQPVDTPLARHAAACGRCTDLVAAFRSEGAALIASLALDASELAFLTAAGLPGQVASKIVRARAVGTADSPATLLAMLITALAAYGGWLLAQPIMATGLDVAERSGAVNVATRLATEWFVGLFLAFWAAVDAVSALPLVDNPALPLALVALLAWLAIWLTSRLPVASQQRAAA
jgi:hypothetical protein